MDLIKKEAAQNAAMPVENPAKVSMETWTQVNAQVKAGMPEQVPVEEPECVKVAMPEQTRVELPEHKASGEMPVVPKTETALILMAIFDSTAFSRLRKSFGNLTTCQHKGQNIVKEKVTQMKNPKTLPQQQQRKKFPSLVKLSKQFSPAITLGLKGSKQRKHTVENYFVHLNKGNVTVDDGLVVGIDFEHLVLSTGNRAIPDEVPATLETEERMLTLTFEESDEILVHSADDDEFYCCVVEKTLLRVKTMRIGKRSELSGSQSLTFPAQWNVSADNLAVYLFCTDKTGKKASKTLYVPLT